MAKAKVKVSVKGTNSAKGNKRKPIKAKGFGISFPVGKIVIHQRKRGGNG